MAQSPRDNSNDFLCGREFPIGPASTLGRRTLHSLSTDSPQLAPTLPPAPPGRRRVTS